MSTEKREAKRAIKKQVKKLVRTYGPGETLKLVTGLVENGAEAHAAPETAAKAKKTASTSAKSPKRKRTPAA